MNNWLSALFRTKRGLNILNMFGNRRNNRGIIWASLLGLGVSTAVYGLRNTRNTNILQPIQNVMNRVQSRTAGPMPNMADLTEFSEELIPQQNINKNK
ncbi:hypothetical protein M670_02074 [Schinkia azotoformans MEV2011]|uniref:Uncharacterized protein n=2 Tax=Schinkia azotoformans TaxID=1454 RepID=K6DQE7_SCHAZ|nr:hypothetical protein [Schinkia azotoformans]EKN62986.1 hypothetical protein BAZO_19538 [Schinkia azotoformans LMG 9581]KEF38448.1 hypothetical protein M670_02074 [Schinkia azotoformans MEV2011]MEC1639278.1 hypothetical protein [Schinkia azotoformans]MEC1697485.1 hypothetical protein [Schinkia azotoformans]MEC1714374.1 hypothetical protein [Schinkia azotoformans]